MDIYVFSPTVMVYKLQKAYCFRENNIDKFREKLSLCFLYILKFLLIKVGRLQFFLSAHASPSVSIGMASPTSMLAEEQVHCSICLDVFTNPVSIPCGHNFCMACIGSYWKSSALFMCPMCKKTFFKQPDISINTVLREIAEKFKAMKSNPVANFQKTMQLDPGLRTHEELPTEMPELIPPNGPWAQEVSCDVCTGPQRRAMKSCLVCLTSYCEEHLKTHTARFTKHKLIEPVQNLEDRMCKKHERLLELFCKKDQTIVCVLCTEMDHRAHYTVPVEREWTEKKVKVPLLIGKRANSIVLSTMNNEQLIDSETLRFTKNIAMDWKGSYTLCMSLISMTNTAIPIMLIHATIIPVLAHLYTYPHFSLHGGK